MDIMRRVTVEADYVDSLEIAVVLRGMQQGVWYQKRKMPEASAMKHSTNGGKLQKTVDAIVRGWKPTMRAGLRPCLALQSCRVAAASGTGCGV